MLYQNKYQVIMYLFFDTETTGLPKNWKAPVTDLNNWPRLVQLAYLFYDKNGNIISKGDHIVKPEGFTIQPTHQESMEFRQKELFKKVKHFRQYYKIFNR